MRQLILSSIKNFQNNPLRKNSDRLEFARTIQSITNYFSVQEICLFLEEMRGLNLKDKNDREVFIDFLSCWVRLEDAR